MEKENSQLQKSELIKKKKIFFQLINFSKIRTHVFLLIIYFRKIRKCKCHLHKKKCHGVPRLILEVFIVRRLFFTVTDSSLEKLNSIYSK